ncbi:GMC family oxidoreductase [Rhodococcus koreensis]|uniref:GMC family oxidoreductase n=1 Tax=Rhodococcus koreensis TaxID=99653 RepID=UPI0036DDFAB3
MSLTESEYEFVIVGSGAGGGPLAANLAAAGHRVLLLEAGDDHSCVYYQAPIFHAQASEDEDMRWDYFVRHYRDDHAQAEDPKHTPDRGGVLYPRGGTLGGSTAISAMITVCPHNSDWDRIATTVGDDSWRAERMRPLFERIERWRDPTTPGADPPENNPARHGYSGWLGTTRADPEAGGREPYFLDIIDTMDQASREHEPPDEDWREPPQDPNDWRVVKSGGTGMIFIPVAVTDGVRNGSRERILGAQRDHPQNLHIEYSALATKIVFDGTRAVGVEYIRGRHVYRADPRARQTDGTSIAPRRIATATAEVIICAGAFNTPQLLKLSGIGPRAELESFGIDVVVDLPGVGENLQDRYEITVVDETAHNYPIFEGSTLDAPKRGEHPDGLFTEWRDKLTGPYTTNGTLAAYVKRSSSAHDDPDLFVFSLPVFFRGYYPGYSSDFTKSHNSISWVVLKAHTNNTAGSVRLRSPDPFDTPDICFNYFAEGSDDGGDDLAAVVDGVEFARALSARLRGFVAHEVLPGPSVRTREEIGNYIRQQAWGHHASCSCKIGADDDPMAVLDGRFRVRGVEGLRVVDASVFPRIPGFFIAAAVWMVSEKASDTILAEYSG